MHAVIYAPAASEAAAPTSRRPQVLRWCCVSRLMASLRSVMRRRHIRASLGAARCVKTSHCTHKAERGPPGVSRSLTACCELWFASCRSASTNAQRVPLSRAAGGGVAALPRSGAVRGSMRSQQSGPVMPSCTHVPCGSVPMRLHACEPPGSPRWRVPLARGSILTLIPCKPVWRNQHRSGPRVSPPNSASGSVVSTRLQ
jgi:hypothetical protein